MGCGPQARWNLAHKSLSPQYLRALDRGSRKAKEIRPAPRRPRGGPHPASAVLSLVRLPVEGEVAVIDLEGQGREAGREHPPPGLGPGARGVPAPRQAARAV